MLGVGIALASIGLSIKRRNPKYLVGLFLPSLGIPAMRGKLGAPEISAFDSLAELALPMQLGLEAVRTFSKDTGSLDKQAASLPAPVALSEQTATTPELRAIFQAAQKNKESTRKKGVLNMAAGQLDDWKPNKTQDPDWLGMAADVLGDNLNIS